MPAGSCVVCYLLQHNLCAPVGLLLGHVVNHLVPGDIRTWARWAMRAMDATIHAQCKPPAWRQAGSLICTCLYGPGRPHTNTWAGAVHPCGAPEGATKQSITLQELKSMYARH